GTGICTDGTVLDTATGACIIDPEACQDGTVLVEGECRDPASIAGDVAECAEPNDPALGGTNCGFTAPATGDSVLISGCITPDSDTADYDVFLFEVAEPTLLDVTVDGYNGLAGGFAVMPTSTELVVNNWMRLGIDLTNDRSQRQLFLPMAGEYLMVVGDSRSFLLDGAAAGDAETCYLATVTGVEIPPATPIGDSDADGLLDVNGTLSGITQFYSTSTPSDGALLFTVANAPISTALIDTVLMTDNQYRGSAPSDSRAAGESASVSIGGLSAAQEVVMVVDPTYDFSMGDSAWELLAFAAPVVGLPGDGGVLNVPKPEGSTTDSSYAVFEANAGDILYLDISSGDLGPEGMAMAILDGNLNPVTAPCNESDPCDTFSDFIQFTEAGLYYMAIRDLRPEPPDSFQLDFNRRVNIQPTLLAEDSSGDATLSDILFDFYKVEPDAPVEWWGINGEPGPNFDGPLVAVAFDGDIRGIPGLDFSTRDAVFMTGSENNGRVIDYGGGPLIYAMFDQADPGAPAGSTYSYSLTNRPYTPVSLLSDGDTYSETGTAVADGGVNLYLLDIAPFSEVEVTVNSDNIDLIVGMHDRDESIISAIDDTSDGLEAGSLVMGAESWMALSVGDFLGDAGSYDLDITVREPPYSISFDPVNTYADICSESNVVEFIEIAFGADDEGITEEIQLPFTFSMLDETYQKFHVSTNGYITLNEGEFEETWQVTTIPDDRYPNALLAPQWSDYDNVVACVEILPDRVTVQWEGTHWTPGDDGPPSQQQMAFYADGTIEFRYGPGHGVDLAFGGGGVIGIENSTGTSGLRLAFNQENSSPPGTTYTFTPNTP
ncbi:MAG: hypothetical protein AAGC55_08260, partial [Myxococcota bacterium]